MFKVWYLHSENQSYLDFNYNIFRSIKLSRLISRNYFSFKGHVIHILQIFDTYLYSIYHCTKSKFKTNKLCFVLRAIQMRLCVYNVQQYYICKCLSIWNRGSTGMSCSENWFFTRFKSLSFGVKYLSCVFGVIFL